MTAAPRDRRAGRHRAGPGDQGPLGPALRRAWVGYQRRLDQEMAAAGFADRAFPDGRVLRMCSGSEGDTVSEIGRELGITRQGASKIVGGLREGRYVTARPVGDRREGEDRDPHGAGSDYLATQRKAARAIEQELRDQVGAEAFEGLLALLEALGGEEDQPGMRDYLRRALRLTDAPEPA